MWPATGQRLVGMGCTRLSTELDRDEARAVAVRCIYVGAGPQDPGFARRLGFQYRDVSEFFGRAE